MFPIHFSLVMVLVTVLTILANRGRMWETASLLSCILVNTISCILVNIISCIRVNIIFFKC